MKIFVFLIIITVHAMSAYAQDNSQNPQVKINHIAISVTDLEESEEFYARVIGLEQIPEPFGVGRHAWFDMGGSQLHVIKASDERTEHDISGHLCFSVNDLDQFTETLTSNEVVYSDFEGNEGQMTNRPDGVRQIYFTDPDGYWIEVNDDF